jgi:hypothetical protein
MATTLITKLPASSYNWYTPNVNYQNYPYAPDLLTGVPSPRKERYRNTRDSTGTSRDWKITLSARGEMVPIIYGECQVGALVFAVVERARYLYVGCIWGTGECEEIVNVYVDDEPTSTSDNPSTAIIRNDYLGTITQTPDNWLSLAIPDYADDLITTINGEQIGICYSVLRIPVGQSFTKIVAQVKGRKVWDPRSSTVVYSTNPSLHLADLLTSKAIGLNTTVDNDSLAACANANDEIVGGQKRREMNLVISRPNYVIKHVEEIQRYAACFLDFTGHSAYMIPNRPVDPQTEIRRHFDEANGDIVGQTIKFKKAKSSNLPTVVAVNYTNRYKSDGSEKENWENDTIYIETLDLQNGQVPWKEAKLALPGYQYRSQALREGIEYLNSLHIEDMSAEFTVFDEAIDVSIGDVITISTEFGVSNKPFRVLNIKNVGPGRWHIFAKEYQPNTYSDELEDDPDIIDTDLPPPASVPDVTGLTASERTYRTVDGTFATMIEVSWDETDYPYDKTYEITISYQTGTNEVEVMRLLTAGISTSSPPLDVIGFYVVRARIVGQGGVSSNWTEYTLEVLGKNIPPGDVPEITGYEVGGQVHLAWLPAVNPTDLSEEDPDIWRYELRYGLVGQAWEEAIVLDRVDALRYITKEIPEGTFDIMIKAIDSVNQYSLNEARIQIEVTADDGSYQAGEYNFVNSELETLVHYYKLTRYDKVQRWISAPDSPADQVFTDLPLSDNYQHLAAVYREGSEVGTSELISETWDAGRLLAGNWRLVLTHNSLLGSHTAYLELSEDGTTWNSYISLSAKTTARYARIRVVSDIANTFLVNFPKAYLSIDISPIEENGSGVSTTDPNNPATITLNKNYAKVIQINVTPINNGGLPTYTAIDNIQVDGVVDSFDVYIYDATNDNLISSEFLWEFKGVG